MNKKATAITKIILSIAIALFTTNTAIAQQGKDNYFRALAAQKANDYTTAIEQIDIALKFAPMNIDFLLLSANLNMATSRYSSAIPTLLKAKKIKQNPATYMLAQCYAMSNKYDSAFFFLNKYLKSYDKKPQWQIKNDSLLNNLVNTEQWNKIWQKDYYSIPEKLLQEAQYKFKYGNLAEALSETNHIIQKYKKFSRAYNLKAQILAAGNNYKEAVKFISKAIELNPSNSNYYKTRAIYYANLKKYSKASDDFDLYFQKNQLDIETYPIAAKIYGQNKQFDKAIEYISTYTKYFTYDNKAMFLQAQINFDAGNYLETIKIINKLFEQTKATPEYYHLRAIAYLNANSYQLAYNDFSMCLDLNPTLTDNYYYRGIASLKMQQINNACADWYSAIEHKDYRANDYYYQYCKEFEKNLKK